jgi:cholesterol transport system auxiliary component
MTIPSDAKIHRRQLLAGAGAAAFLSGCSSVLPAPAPVQLYVLRPDLMPPMGPPVRWRLAVATPDASAALDTTRIALIRTATTMDYYANSAWPDRAPLLLQRMLVEAFEKSGRIQAVDRDTAGLTADFVLQTELRNFEARYEGPNPQVQVTIEAKMVQIPDRMIVSSTNVTQTANASANTVDSVVLAFDQATGAAINQITSWALATPAGR